MRLSKLAAAGLAAATAAGACATPAEDGTQGSPAAAGNGAPAISRDAKSGICEATLPNGLKILVLEKPGVPVVSHHVMYRVGAVDERPGETGLAHYLEHVMFKGTKQIRKGDIDLLTFRGGGANNAYTTCDFTEYFFNFEASRWRLALEIEADRMRNCAFVPKEFEAERGAVLNEMHAAHDAPGGRLDEEVDAAGYVLHPYHHPVIGWQQEVEEVARSTVIGFYDRYYMPNNATMVVVGDVKAADVVAAAAEAFADVKPGPVPPPVVEIEPVQRGEKRLVLVEDIDTPRVMVAWHTCRVGDDDDAVLDVASSILGGSKSSRLYQRLVEKDRTCTDLSLWNETRKYPGRFKVWCEGQQGADPRSIEAAIHDEVARFAAGGPTPREMEKAKNNLLARELFSRETAAGTAERLGALEASRGWKVFVEWPDRIRAVTAADVKAAVGKYLVARNRTVGWSIPEGQAGLAVPPAPVADGPSVPAAAADAPGAPEAPAAAEAPAMARKAAPPEEAGAAPTFRGGRSRALDLSIPKGPAGAVRIAPRVERLPNGLTVLLQRHGTLPVLSVELHVPAGQLVEAKPGLSWITGDLLDEGAGERNAEQIADALDFLGASLSTSPLGVRAHCLSKDTEAVLDLVADVLLRPRFSESDVEKCRQVQLSEIAAADDNPQAVGRKAFLKAIYGDHPYGRPAMGDAESVKSITRDEILGHHGKWFVPDDAVLAVAGDFDPDAMLASLRRRFGDWKAGKPVRPAPEVKPLEKAVRIDAAMEGKSQSNVFVGNLGIRRTDPDYAAQLVLDHVLGTGPGFSDRLSKDLRDEQGLAYTVYANAFRSASEEPGTFNAFIACLGDDLPKAIDGLFGHLRRIREEPVSDVELADAKSYLVGSQVFKYETSEQVAAILVDLQRYGLGFDYPAKFPAMVDAVTKEDVLRVARKNIRPDQGVVVVSGYVGK
jgi:zinc protease